mmetsp:Transcript_90998/g.257087  ORF Transcript_90998/g.257087 Transcript_90998/m.257087 type:complete len:212 (+) Transcript_90998:1125-1760(+)
MSFSAGREMLVWRRWPSSIGGLTTSLRMQARSARPTRSSRRGCMMTCDYSEMPWSKRRRRGRASRKRSTELAAIALNSLCASTRAAGEERRWRRRNVAPAKKLCGSRASREDECRRNSTRRCRSSGTNSSAPQTRWRSRSGTKCRTWASGRRDTRSSGRKSSAPQTHRRSRSGAKCRVWASRWRGTRRGSPLQQPSWRRSWRPWSGVSRPA